MKFKEAIATAWKKRWNFSGRASRSEYNWAGLFLCLLGLVPLILFYLPLGGVAISMIIYEGKGELLRTELQQQGFSHPLVTLIGLPAVLFLLSFLAWLGCAIWDTFTVSARRLQDLNYSGWWSVILSFGPTVLDMILQVLFKNAEGLAAALSLLVSLASFVAWILTMCVKGTEGPNRYGEDPLALEALSPAPAEPASTDKSPTP